jgi:hypothetical protein
MNKSTPGNVTDFSMIIRFVQEGIIPDMRYTTSDINRLRNHITELLTGKLNFLLDQDPQMFQSQDGDLPSLLGDVDLKKGRRCGGTKDRPCTPLN